MALNPKPLADLRKDIPVSIVKSNDKARVNFDLSTEERMQWHVYSLAHNKSLKAVIVEAMNEHMKRYP